jgi:hypothetical protein
MRVIMRIIMRVIMRIEGYRVIKRVFGCYLTGPRAGAGTGIDRCSGAGSAPYL